MADELNEIMRALGRLEEGQDRMRADFDEEKEHTRESRERTYRTLEKIGSDVVIVGQVAAQARAQAEAVEKVVVEDIKPVTDEVRRMKLMGLGALAVVGFAGGVLGVFAGQIIEAIRTWLAGGPPPHP